MEQWSINFEYFVAFVVIHIIHTYCLIVTRTNFQINILVGRIDMLILSFLTWCTCLTLNMVVSTSNFLHQFMKFIIIWITRVTWIVFFHNNAISVNLYGQLGELSIYIWAALSNEFCYESCPWCRIVFSTCWPALQRITPVLPLSIHLTFWI